MRIITLTSGIITVVKNVLNTYELQSDEFQSEIGELGQRMLSNGSFEDVSFEIIPEPKQPSNAEIAQMINDLQADLIIAGVI